MNRIAIVGMACVYPDATTPKQLWENAISGRRAFRRIPETRTSLNDYHDPDPAAPDKFYSDHAAVLEGYEFDRVSFKIAGSTYRSTDLTHWLALDVASQALKDAGFEEGEGLPRERTGVIVGNTLTGEFSRANLMRLRWPYVRRVLAAELRQDDWAEEAIADFVNRMEVRYKAPFPEVDEDSLAGGLSNTIAGRICNYFDLNGGGYTVDGACSSSLLSTITAAQSLADGDFDVAIAGGVDLSIDPFEIIGFAKTGALAKTEMRLYDERSNGFWPGEGCGMVVLMREEDAIAAGRTPMATLAGWGVSSDGAGGMTRPELSGYQLAMQRAYDRAGFGIGSVPYFEGHGTGTPVGDDLELTAVSTARHQSGAEGRAAIGSVKAQIGHTKAAAGVAGLIKAVQAVRHGVLPPTIGCTRPHPRFGDEDSTIRPIGHAEPWPEGAPLRAGVSSMGFGGINTHLVVEGESSSEDLIDWDAHPEVQALAATRQDCEALFFGAASREDLISQIRTAADGLAVRSFSELTDYAVVAAQTAAGTYRAAAVVTSPAEGMRKLRALADQIAASPDPGNFPARAAVNTTPEGYWGYVPEGRSIKVGLLFPGQGTGSHLHGGALEAHLTQRGDTAIPPTMESLLDDPVATQNAQPLTVRASLVGLQALESLGIEASAATGHSLGELCSLHWAGAFGAHDVLDLARTRGAIMAEHALPGTMATLEAPADVVHTLLRGTNEVTVAAHNSNRLTVVAGTDEAVDAVVARAEDAGVRAKRLPVSHAFHSPLVQPAAEALRPLLADTPISTIDCGRREVVSTVTGSVLQQTDFVPEALRALLSRQIVEPVLFADAVKKVAANADLLIEVGPGCTMAQLAAATTPDAAVISLDTDETTLEPYLSVAAAAWVGGAMPDPAILNRDRFHRQLVQEPKFLNNPAEQVEHDLLPQRASAPTEANEVESGASEDDALALLITMAAERAELPVEAVHAESRLLDDLHLSSITVGQIMTRVASAVGVTDFGSLNLATSTIGELAAGLENLRGGAESKPGTDPLGSVGDFVGTWAEEFVPVPLRDVRDSAASATSGNWTMQGVADANTWLSPLKNVANGGVLLELGPDLGREQMREAFEAVRQAAALGAGERLVILGGADATTALAKTLFLEHPELHVTVVDGSDKVRPETVAAEVAGTVGFRHVRYEGGARLQPYLVPHPLTELPRLASTTEPSSAVLLASGGAKGITAECALAWAKQLEAKVALLGRSSATSDEVVETLRRLEEAGVEARYIQADVTDPAAVRAAVGQAVAQFGSITHLIHGAGSNQPATIENLEWSDVQATLAPKADGLTNILEAITEIDDQALQHVATFGSVIGRAGLWGEAHYAMANAELARITREHGRTHPHCSTTCLEFTVWSDVGMGARMGAVESLKAAGITSIDPDDGISYFLRSVTRDTAATVVVCGRLDGVPTVSAQPEELPLGRFLDRVRRHHPKYELVTDTIISAGTDLYLADHRIEDNLVIPAVMGLEAMTQVAAAVYGNQPTSVRFTNVQLTRPLIVPRDGELTVRVGAVRRTDDTLDVVVLSEETNYDVAHFSATVEPNFTPGGPVQRLAAPPTSGAVPLDPEVDLYQGILFQRGRFQRVLGYDAMSSRHVRCRVEGRADRWFADSLPNGLVLGDPGVRDAVMHGNQVSVPDGVLLPQGVDTLEVLDPFTEGDRTFIAHEVRHEGNLHVYDIDVLDHEERVVERWRGLQLRSVQQREPQGWPHALLGPHLERVLQDAGYEGAVEVAHAPRSQSLEVTASIDGAACVTRSAQGDSSTNDESVRQALLELLDPADDHEAEIHVVDESRGTTRFASGPAQAISAVVEDRSGETMLIVIAWLAKPLVEGSVA